MTACEDSSVFSPLFLICTSVPTMYCSTSVLGVSFLFLSTRLRQYAWVPGCLVSFNTMLGLG